mmetsp:Transcript_147574/g.472026  ORF Transcript_147574/g.472026 Transcript_147574/m.472026 type:complete len:330 (+) Transcript_147574:576-1565(+)
MIGLVVGSTLVSLLSAGMVEMKMLSQYRDNQMRLLTQYLRENAIRGQIGTAVRTQVLERLSDLAKLKSSDVPVLSLLSRELRMRLHSEVCMAHLVSHPLLRLCMHLDDRWPLQLCDAIEVVHHHKDDCIFAPCTNAKAAYVLIDGAMLYSQTPGSSMVAEEWSVELSHRCWLSQAALWSEWLHVGELTATEPCQVLEVNADACAQAFIGNRVVGTLASEYCRCFHACLAAAKPPMAEWPNDIEVQFAGFGDIVSTMTRESRINIAMVSSHMVEAKAGFLQSSAATDQLRAELLDEVSAGKSVLVLAPNGDLERVLSLAVLRLSEQDRAL